MVNDYPFDRPKKSIYNEKKRLTNLLSPHCGFVVRDLSVYTEVADSDKFRERKKTVNDSPKHS